MVSRKKVRVNLASLDGEQKEAFRRQSKEIWKPQKWLAPTAVITFLVLCGSLTAAVRLPDYSKLALWIAEGAGVMLLPLVLGYMQQRSRIKDLREEAEDSEWPT